MEHSGFPIDADAWAAAAVDENAAVELTFQDCWQTLACRGKETEPSEIAANDSRSINQI